MNLFYQALLVLLAIAIILRVSYYFWQKGLMLDDPSYILEGHFFYSVAKGLAIGFSVYFTYCLVFGG